MAVVIRLGAETRSGISAGIWTAMVSVDFALVSGVANWTDAFEGVDQIPALATVLARFRSAFVDVDVAVFPGKSRAAGAVVVIDEVNAESVMLTLAHAVVDVLRAVFTRETVLTSTPGTKYGIRYYDVLITIGTDIWK